MKLTPCSKCQDGWFQYLINRDIFKCAKCGYEEAWSKELDDRFNGKNAVLTPAYRDLEIYR